MTVSLPSTPPASRAEVAASAIGSPMRPSFIYVINRLEGNALRTIEAMLDS